MMLNDLERAAASLAARAWPEAVGDPALAPRLLSLLLEEAGELAQAVRLLAGPRRGHPGEAAASIEQVEDEIGDVLFLLARIALATGASLETAAWRVIGKIERRIEGAAGRGAGS